MLSEIADSPHNEKQIYDDLSQLILTFKKLVSQAENVAILIEKDQDHTDSLLKIKSLLQTLDPLKQKYEAMSEVNYIQSTLFYRFICRLLQVIAYLNGRAQSRGNEHHHLILNKCIKEIEQSIKRCKESKQLFRLIKIIQVSFIKFCINCKAVSNVVDEAKFAKCQQALNGMREKVIKEKKLFQNTHKNNKYNYIFTQMDLSQSEQSDIRSEKEFKMTMNRKKYNFHAGYSKQLAKLQNRFETLKDLDLDYSAFKSDYFMAKGNQTHFYLQYLEKNGINKRIITNYYDDFHLFQKKRSQKELKKNKYKLQTYLKNFQSSTLCDDSEGQNNESRTKNISHQEENQMRTNRMRKSSKINGLDDQGTRSLECDMGVKKQLKMKSVQITLLNPHKQAKKFKVISNGNKNKSKLQPICINQSYYNGLESQTKNSLQFLHRKLRVEVQLKKCNKTQLQRINKKDNNISEIHSMSDINKQYDSNIISLKSKSSFKGKYLEVTCKGEKREEEIRKQLLKQGGSIIQKLALKNVKSLCKKLSHGKLLIKNQK